MRNALIIAGAVGAVLLTAGPTAAQTQMARPERPYVGLYAGGGQSQGASVNGSVGAGYDTDAQLAAVDNGAPGVLALPSVGSFYNQFSGGLSYSLSTGKFSLGASLSLSARKYPQLDIPLTVGNAGSIAGTFQVNRKTSVSGGVSASYHSLRNFTPFPELPDTGLGQIEAPSADFGSVRAKYINYSSNLGVIRQLSRRGTLTGSYSYHASTFANDVGSLSNRSAGIRYSYGLSRYMSLRLGYGYSGAIYQTTDRQYRNHTLDTGVDYSRALSITRRTKFSFSTGGTVVKQAEETRVDVIGSAALTREIGRSWNASIVYQRNVGFSEVVLAPIFSDAVNANYGGLINRRLSFHSGAGISRGTVGVVATRSNNGFDVADAYAGLSQALSRHLAVNFNYSFYHYNFEPGAAFVSTLIPRTNRHSVHLTVSAWAPIFQHGRKR